MNEYKFETKEFAVSEKGIHFLRSRFNYETIGFNELASFRIDIGREVNNWILLLAIGILFLSFSIYYTVGMFYIIANNEVRVIHIEEIIIPVLPFLVGGYFVYASMQNGMMLSVTTIKGKTKRLPLKELVKENKLSEFQQWWKERCGSLA